MSEIIIVMPEMFSVEEASKFREDIRSYISTGYSSFLLDFGGCLAHRQHRAWGDCQLL